MGATIVLAWAWAWAWAPVADAQAVRVDPGVQYGAAPVLAPMAASAPLLLDLYRPAEPATVLRPAVVLIHGGGFTRRSRADPPIVAIARGLAARGVVVASIDYRLLDREPVPSARVAPLLAGLPDAPISRAIVSAAGDTLTAIGYLRRHAGTLGIDRRRLGLIGSSAGAITADQVGYVLDDHGIHAPRLRFVASLWGGILVAPPPGRGVAATQLERGEPPLFAVHGDADPTVPVRLDDELVARARRVGVRTEYHRIPGGVHGFAGARFFTGSIDGSPTPFARLLDFATTELARGRDTRPPIRRAARR